MSEDVKCDYISDVNIDVLLFLKGRINWSNRMKGELFEIDEKEIAQVFT